MKKIFSMVLVIVLLLCCTACGMESENAPPTTEPTQALLTVDGLLEVKTEDDLFCQSSLIVRGTITERSDAFQVEGVLGQIGIYTDCVVTISDCYRGEPVRDAITVRVNGGVFGDINEVHTLGAQLKTGESYLLFLYQPGYGLNNAAGNYYYVLGLSQGVFSQQEDGSYLSQFGVNLKEETLTARAKEYPVDPQYFRNEFIENQKGNLERGMITQEEYDMVMAKIDEYAVIVYAEE